MCIDYILFGVGRPILHYLPDTFTKLVCLYPLHLYHVYHLISLSIHPPHFFGLLLSLFLSKYIPFTILSDLEISLFSHHSFKHAEPTYSIFFHFDYYLKQKFCLFESFHSSSILFQFMMHSSCSLFSYLFLNILICTLKNSSLLYKIWTFHFWFHMFLKTTILQ